MHQLAGLNRRARTFLVRSLRFVDRNLGIQVGGYPQFAKWVYGAVGAWDVKAFRNPPDPLEPIFVDPNQIRRFSGRYRGWENAHLLLGSVRSGDWDVRDPTHLWVKEFHAPKTFEEYNVHRAFEEHFIRGVPWERTERYATQIEVARTEGRDALNRLSRKLEWFDQLYESIRKEGYRSNLEISRKNYLTRLVGEILVDVGRDGDFLFVDGRHRLSIAKLLGIEKIPVCVLVRHSLWMEHRDRLMGNGQAIDHPDCRQRPREARKARVEDRSEIRADVAG